MTKCKECGQQLPGFYVTGDMFENVESTTFKDTKWMLSRVSSVGWTLVGITDNADKINGVAWGIPHNLDEQLKGPGCQSRCTVDSFKRAFPGFIKVDA